MKDSLIIKNAHIILNKWSMHYQENNIILLTMEISIRQYITRLPVHEKGNTRTLNTILLFIYFFYSLEIYKIILNIDIEVPYEIANIRFPKQPNVCVEKGSWLFTWRVQTETF